MRGFTLIELLVAMMIVAMTAFVVFINAPPAQSSTKIAAERFALGLSIADDASALTGQPIRLVVEDRRYFFERYAAGEWAPTKLGKFPLISDVPGGIAFEMTAESQVADNEAELLRLDEKTARKERQDVMIDPAGLPIKVDAVFQGPGSRWLVTRNKSGEVSIVRGKQ